jgi:hypothetical protein
VIDLFRPNLAIISSANGKQYRHPHRKTYEWLMSVITAPSFQQYGLSENSILCFGTYNQEENISGYYNPKSKTTNPEYSALTKYNTTAGARIISTNFSGTLKRENGIFSRTFSPICEYNNTIYKINLNQRVAKSSLINGSLYYWIDNNSKNCVIAEYSEEIDFDKYLVYSLEELIDDATIEEQVS